MLSELGEERYGDLVDARPHRPPFQVAVSDATITMIGISGRNW